MIRTQKEINELLEEVISQAEALGIPVSSQINSGVVVNKRAKSRFGCCKTIRNPSLKPEYEGQVKNKNVNLGKSQIESRIYPRYIIEISKTISEGPRESIKAVLAHEILHTIPGGGNHTGVWKKYASIMNQNYGYHIQRTNSPESLGVSLSREKPIAKYLIICKACGMVQERSRISRVIKRPSLYRCKCGGKLKVSRTPFC